MGNELLNVKVNWNGKITETDMNKKPEWTVKREDKGKGKGKDCEKGSGQGNRSVQIKKHELIIEGN